MRFPIFIPLSMGNPCVQIKMPSQSKARDRRLHGMKNCACCAPRAKPPAAFLGALCRRNGQAGGRNPANQGHYGSGDGRTPCPVLGFAVESYRPQQTHSTTAGDKKRKRARFHCRRWKWKSCEACRVSWMGGYLDYLRGHPFVFRTGLPPRRSRRSPIPFLHAGRKRLHRHNQSLQARGPCNGNAAPTTTTRGFCHPPGYSPPSPRKRRLFRSPSRMTSRRECFATSLLHPGESLLPARRRSSRHCATASR